MQLWVAQPTATRDGDAGLRAPRRAPAGRARRRRSRPCSSATSPARRHRRAATPTTSASTSTSAPGHDVDPARTGVRARARRVRRGRASSATSVASAGSPRVPRHRPRRTSPTNDRSDPGVARSAACPFAEPVLMWWNYVARDRDEIAAAHADWTAGSERFGHVASPLPRVDIGPPPWTTGQR